MTQLSEQNMITTSTLLHRQRQRHVVHQDEVPAAKAARRPEHVFEGEFCGPALLDMYRSGIGPARTLGDHSPRSRLHVVSTDVRKVIHPMPDAAFLQLAISPDDGGAAVGEGRRRASVRSESHVTMTPQRILLETPTLVGLARAPHGIEAPVSFTHAQPRMARVAGTHASASRGPEVRVDQREEAGCDQQLSLHAGPESLAAISSVDRKPKAR